jgi:hypothetical protein
MAPRNSKSKNGMKKNIQAKKRMNKKLAKIERESENVMVVERSIFPLYFLDVRIFLLLSVVLAKNHITSLRGYLSVCMCGCLCTDLMK